MAKLNGKWRFVSQDNLDGFHTAKKTPEAYKEFLRGLGQKVKADPNVYVEQLTIDVAAGTANRTAFVGGEKKRETTVKIDQEQDVTLADGRAAKGTVHVNSETKATLTEKGDGFEAVAVYEAHGNELVVTQTCAGQVATLKFTKV